jgi:UDP-GlcNAc3NAcA epimerase
MRIATIVGNRPQLIKAAAVCAALRRRHEEILIHTGQHYDDGLSGVFFEELELPLPDRNLGLGGASNTTQTARMLLALEGELRALAPDAVLVYGDTNSTLAGALAAAQQGLALIHVEAGMRCFDRTMPEEINRVLADQLSALCLCSTETAVSNLAREAVPGTVVLVGDVMADIALRCAQLARSRSTA